MGRLIEYKTEDCPDAKGKIPNEGDVRYSLTFPLEDGSFLKVYMGKVGRDAIVDMLSQNALDEATEKAQGN